ncbi:hypothetical protein ACN38_g6940 [Penicillium nordicum]|uniref:Uncharacterized protein n=1 Tax=Penicillium nordicum TaxID=229535 RepID=A0A0M8NZ53_9EURO|nr:hypothetical protein ACN38_g6940 [Penicillium nordicum]
MYPAIGRIICKSVGLVAAVPTLGPTACGVEYWQRISDSACANSWRSALTAERGEVLVLRHGQVARQSNLQTLNSKVAWKESLLHPILVRRATGSGSG